MAQARYAMNPTKCGYCKSKLDVYKCCPKACPECQQHGSIVDDVCLTCGTSTPRCKAPKCAEIACNYGLNLRNGSYETVCREHNGRIGLRFGTGV